MIDPLPRMTDPLPRMLFFPARTSPVHACLCVLSGTTTATVLTRAILSEGCKSVAAGMNPMDLRRGINLAVDHVVKVCE